MKKLFFLILALCIIQPCQARMYSIGEVCIYMKSSQFNAVTITPEDRYNSFLYNWQCRVSTAANEGRFEDAAWAAQMMLDDFYAYENMPEIWSKSPFKTQKAALNSLVMNYMFSEMFRIAQDPYEARKYVGGLSGNRFQLLNAGRGMDSVFQYSNRLTYLPPPAHLLYTNACKSFLPRFRRTGKINNEATFRFVEAFILRILADEVKCPDDYVGVVKEYIHYCYFLKLSDSEITRMVERRTLELDEDCDSNRFGEKYKKSCYAGVAELRNLIAK